jgi:Tfp pilus assembly protein PilW
MATSPRINVDITADDQADGELVARLITAQLSEAGFEDVTNVSGPTHNDKDEEVLEAMRNLSPAIFNAEVVVDVSVFEETALVAGADDDDIPGDQFPDQGPTDDDAIPGADE